jgi:hypothetical protein
LAGHALSVRRVGHGLLRAVVLRMRVLRHGVLRGRVLRVRALGWRLWVRLLVRLLGRRV